MIIRCVLVAAVLSLGLGAVACSSSKPDTAVVIASAPAPRPGPPPHAPAHGYRMKHRDGVDLVYDAPRGVYLVVHHSGTYWCDGRYYRHRGSRWEMSVNIRGPWNVTATASVPGNLTTDQTASKMGKGKKKKHKH